MAPFLPSAVVRCGHKTRESPLFCWPSSEDDWRPAKVAPHLSSSEMDIWRPDAAAIWDTGESWKLKPSTEELSDCGAALGDSAFVTHWMSQKFMSIDLI